MAGYDDDVIQAVLDISKVMSTTLPDFRIDHDKGIEMFDGIADVIQTLVDERD